MTRKQTERAKPRVAWLAAVLALALVFASPAAGAAPAPTKRTAKFEVRFMTEMIDHHAMAVEMSEVCLDKAVHAELRAMCQEMIAAQSQEIETMQSWLEDWYGVSHEPEMSRRDMRMIERLAALSGARFEIRFMETMIEHHRQAIAEAERCLDRAYHAELRNLCRQIIEAQSAEIAQLGEWLCVWYGRCHRDDRHGDDDDDDDRHEDDDHGNRHKDRH